MYCFHARFSLVINLKYILKKSRQIFPVTHFCPGLFLPLVGKWCYFNDLVINNIMDKRKKMSCLILWQKLLVILRYQFLPSSLVLELLVLTWVHDQAEQRLCNYYLRWSWGVFSFCKMSLKIGFSCWPFLFLLLRCGLEG